MMFFVLFIFIVVRLRFIIVLCDSGAAVVHPMLLLADTTVESRARRSHRSRWSRLRTMGVHVGREHENISSDQLAQYRDLGLRGYTPHIHRYG